MSTFTYFKKIHSKRQKYYHVNHCLSEYPEKNFGGYQSQILGLRTVEFANFLWYVMTFTTVSAISIHYSPEAS